METNSQKSPAGTSKMHTFSALNPKDVNYIYYNLHRFEPLLDFIPKEDALQEIRLALLSAGTENPFKVASRFIYHLIRAFGYSQKCGKDNFNAFYFPDELAEDQALLITDIEDYYYTHTARNTCAHFNFPPTKKVVGALSNCFPKFPGIRPKQLKRKQYKSVN